MNSRRAAAQVIGLLVMLGVVCVASRVHARYQSRVARGDSISRGQTVAEVGEGDPSFLHFEVRRGFDAVDPNGFLP